MTNLRNKIAGAVVGLASIFGSANADMMKMESRPVITSVNPDGSKNLKVDVYLTRDVDGNGTADAPEISGISSWRLTMPTELQSYLTPVSASLPDMVNQKSTNPDDVLYNLKMQTVGTKNNYVSNFVDGVSWSDVAGKFNCRDPPYTIGTFSTKMDGIVASYDLILQNGAPNGDFAFNLVGENQSTQVYDKNGQRYNIYGGADENHLLQINNQPFTVVPEPATAALLAAGGAGMLSRRMNRGKGKWVDAKSLEGKASE